MVKDDQAIEAYMKKQQTSKLSIECASTKLVQAKHLGTEVK